MTDGDTKSGDEAAAAARTETRYIVLTVAGNAVLGALGIGFFFAADSQAILLDGLFNLAYFLSGLLTLRVAFLLRRADTEAFPFGYAFFEPMVNGLKGVLVLGVTLMAMLSAIEALFDGGQQIETGPAMLYGVLATAGCVALALATWHGARKTGSPLVYTDAVNWVVNGAISGAVLMAFVGIFLITGTEYEYMAPYVDPTLVLLVAAITFVVPVRIAGQALLDLLNRAPAAEMVSEVRETIAGCLAGLPVNSLHVRMIQPGRTRIIVAYAVLPEDHPAIGLQELDALHVDVLKALRAVHRETWADLVFTANPALAEPSGRAMLLA